jgi:hypothetical protein
MSIVAACTSAGKMEGPPQGLVSDFHCLVFAYQIEKTVQPDLAVLAFMARAKVSACENSFPRMRGYDVQCFAAGYSIGRLIVMKKRHVSFFKIF